MEPEFHSPVTGAVVESQSTREPFPATFSFSHANYHSIQFLVKTKSKITSVKGKLLVKIL